MGAHIIESGGEATGLVVVPENGEPPYVVPPIVFDESNRLVSGHEVLEAVLASGVEVEVPIVRDASPARVAEIDQVLARFRDDTGIGQLT